MLTLASYSKCFFSLSFTSIKCRDSTLHAVQTQLSLYFSGLRKKAQGDTGVNAGVFDMQVRAFVTTSIKYLLYMQLHFAHDSQLRG